MKKVYGKQIKPPKILYHTSNPKNRKSVLKHGLIPRIGEQLYAKDYVKYKKAVYLSYAPWNSTYDDDIWQIDTTKIKNKFVEDLNIQSGAIVTFTKVSKGALKLIHKGTGESE